MTLLTHRAELVVVRIIPGVTEAAGLIQLDTVNRLRAMTVITVQFFVRPIEFETRVFIVIEFPHGPAVGVVALRAFRPQTRLVYIVPTMAIDTLFTCRLELAIGVTTVTGHQCMQTGEWEITHVMIEHQLR